MRKFNNLNINKLRRTNKSTRKKHLTFFAVQLSLFIYQSNDKLERTRIKNSRPRGKKAEKATKRINILRSLHVSTRIY